MRYLHHHTKLTFNTHAVFLFSPHSQKHYVAMTQTTFKGPASFSNPPTIHHHISHNLAPHQVS